MNGDVTQDQSGGSGGFLPEATNVGDIFESIDVFRLLVLYDLDLGATNRSDHEGGLPTMKRDLSESVLPYRMKERSGRKRLAIGLNQWGEGISE